MTSVPSRIVRRLAGDPAERDPGVGRAGQPAAVTHREIVVAAEERSESELLGTLCHRQQIVVGRALLRLGEDAEIGELHDDRRYR